MYLFQDRKLQPSTIDGYRSAIAVSFIRWTFSETPPVKSVADFLMYLFQDRKLQPSTVDGYRSAFADSLGNLPINVSKDENLTRLVNSFH